MLRSNTGDPNRITFILDLQTDPRYRQHIQAIKKDVSQAQSEMLKGEQMLDVRRTQVLERGEVRRATVRKSALDRMIADEERALNRLDAQLARIEANRRAATRDRIIGNVLDSAGVRNAADEARANYYKRRQEKERQDAYNDARMQIVWAEAANRNAVERIKNEQQLQVELRRTADVQRRHFSQAGTGFRQMGSGVGHTATGLAMLGAGGNFEKLLTALTIGTGTYLTAKGLGLSAQGISNAVSGLGGIVQGTTYGATAYAGKSAFNVGMRTLGGLALRGATHVAMPALLANEWLNADEAGYQAMLAAQDQRARNAMLMGGAGFDASMGANGAALRRNEMLFGLGLRGGGQFNAVLGNAGVNFRNLAFGAEQGLALANRGMGMVGGREVRLSPSEAAQQQSFYADQAAAGHSGELEVLKQQLEYRRLIRTSISDANMEAFRGLDRVTQGLREQLAIERQKGDMVRQQGRSAYAMYANASPMERQRIEAAVAAVEKGTATAQQRQLAAGFPGVIGERANELSTRVGMEAARGGAFDKIIRQDQERAKAREADLQNLVKAAEAGSQASRQAMEKALTQVFDRLSERFVDVVLDAEKRAKDAQQVAEEKRGNANAVVRQAEK